MHTQRFNRRLKRYVLIGKLCENVPVRHMQWDDACMEKAVIRLDQWRWSRRNSKVFRDI